MNGLHVALLVVGVFAGIAAWAAVGDWRTRRRLRNDRDAAAVAAAADAYTVHREWLTRTVRRSS